MALKRAEGKLDIPTLVEVKDMVDPCNPARNFLFQFCHKFGSSRSDLGFSSLTQSPVPSCVGAKTGRIRKTSLEQKKESILNLAYRGRAISLSCLGRRRVGGEDAYKLSSPFLQRKLSQENMELPVLLDCKVISSSKVTKKKIKQNSNVESTNPADLVMTNLSNSQSYKPKEERIRRKVSFDQSLVDGRSLGGRKGQSERDFEEKQAPNFDLIDSLFFEKNNSSNSTSESLQCSLRYTKSNEPIIIKPQHRVPLRSHSHTDMQKEKYQRRKSQPPNSKFNDFTNIQGNILEKVEYRSVSFDPDIKSDKILSIQPSLPKSLPVGPNPYELLKKNLSEPLLYQHNYFLSYTPCPKPYQPIEQKHRTSLLSQTSHHIQHQRSKSQPPSPSTRYNTHSNAQVTIVGRFQNKRSSNFDPSLVKHFCSSNQPLNEPPPKPRRTFATEARNSCYFDEDFCKQLISKSKENNKS